MSKADHKRIVYCSWRVASLINEAKSFMDKYDYDAVLLTINDAIEIYNAYKILYETHSYDETTLKKTKGIVARFIKEIDSGRFYAFYQTVLSEYYEDYLSLIEMFEPFDNISGQSLKLVFRQESFILYKLLRHKKIVEYYDQIIAEYMRHSDQGAEIIISQYLEKRSPDVLPYYLPKSLMPNEYEQIIWHYIDSDYPSINLVSLVANSLSSKECPLSDELRFHAKKRTEALFSRPGVVVNDCGLAIGISFEDVDTIKRVTQPEPNHFLYSYDYKWIDENKDYPTILNNFIYLFDYCDYYLRCLFPVTSSSLGTFERLVGVTGVREYKTGMNFSFKNDHARIVLHYYSAFLLKRKIYIEDIIQWFFDSYMKEEFGINEFEVNFPSNSYTNLDKCKLALTELDGILNQYKVFVEKGTINREMYERSSNQVVFGTLPSFIPNKYSYVSSEELSKEMELCFSSQSSLSYVEKYYQTNPSENTFFDLAWKHDLYISDFKSYSKDSLSWLEKRGTIHVDHQGKITLKKVRILILKDLYEHDVIRSSRFLKYHEYQDLIDNGELTTKSLLFSEPEIDFLNYMLNKREYSNGADIRNRYIHGSYPQDKNQHYNDYLDILRIIIVIIIKLNEEFSFKFK